MSDYKEHVRDCELQLGNGWKEVHDWLDEYAKIYWPWKGHRVHRHHLEGIEEVRAKWGDEAAYAAELHIVEDEGKIFTREEMNKRYGVQEVDSKHLGMLKNEREY